MLILRVKCYEVQAISAYVGVDFDVFNYNSTMGMETYCCIVFSHLSALRVVFVSIKNNVNAVVFLKPGGSSVTKMRHIT
jgi:hypothetical protein